MGTKLQISALVVACAFAAGYVFVVYSRNPDDPVRSVRITPTAHPDGTPQTQSQAGVIPAEARSGYYTPAAAASVPHGANSYHGAKSHGGGHGEGGCPAPLDDPEALKRVVARANQADLEMCSAPGEQAGHTPY